MDDLLKDIFTWVFVLSFAVPALRRLLSPRRKDSSSPPLPTYEEASPQPEEASFPEREAPAPPAVRPVYDVVQALEEPKSTFKPKKLIPIAQPSPPEALEDEEEDNAWIEALRSPQSARQTLILGEILRPKF